MTVQAMAMEMTEKIDRESVGFIVHEKYEEIVRYLQDALQSSLEDENRFKQKADEIQEMVILLTNSKADRTEIQHMQELMVRVVFDWCVPAVLVAVSHGMAVRAVDGCVSVPPMRTRRSLGRRRCCG